MLNGVKHDSVRVELSLALLLLALLADSRYHAPCNESPASISLE